MSNKTFRKLEQAFQDALKLDPHQRSTMLKSLAEKSPKLAEQLAALLAADDDSDRALETAIASAAAAFSGADQTGLIGQTLGVWTIEKLIGSGGMGAVFLAHRSDKLYEQQVAIKVMATRVFDAAVTARFAMERQILATLNHPGIATLIDGGTTHDGIPFLVMEYVEGTPIDRYCRDNELNLNQHLQVFLAVCEAVDYAHRNLVVHRDLKPANILVTDDGEPKLLDFGIAKLLDPSASDTQTGLGQRAMTPEFASPEQIRGQRVSVASDVYALGVLLYRLLTNQSPYGESTTTHGDMERRVLEHTPQRPSVVGASSAQHAIVARRLAGDLDNIVLKCLSKAPERRYASVADLRADIHRFLNHEPVLARGDSVLYRFHKLLVRRAGWVTAGTAAVAIIAALTTFYTLGLARERDLAQRAASQAEQVSEFMLDVFENSSPSVSKGEVPTAVDLLEQGVAEIEQMADQPVLQAELLNVFGRSLTFQGYMDKATPLLEKAMVLKREHDADDLLGLADIHNSLSENYRLRGEHDLGIEHMQKVLNLNEQVYGIEHPDVAYYTSRLGSTHLSAGNLEQAIDYISKARQMRQTYAPEIDRNHLEIVALNAVALGELGRNAEGLELTEWVAEQTDELDGRLAPNSIIRVNNLGINYRKFWQFEKAQEKFDEAIV